LLSKESGSSLGTDQTAFKRPLSSVELTKEKGMERIIAKNKGSIYRPGKRTRLLEAQQMALFRKIATEAAGFREQRE
jgi:hypothetical protein